MRENFSLSLLDIAESGLEYYLKKFSDVMILCHSEYINPQLQKGPECGIVALSMATELVIGSVVNKALIFDEAYKRKFSLKGEMYSAENMALLAKTVCSSKATVLSDLLFHKRTLVDHILLGYPVLIPYDADRNHSPCCRNGHYAHWAVITGIGLVVRDSDFYDEFTSSTSALPKVYMCDKQYLSLCFEKSLAVTVFTLQGKSQKMAMWDLEELLKSNYNLHEVAKPSCLEEMVIPAHDSLSGLRDKAVLLFPDNGNLLNQINDLFQCKVHWQFSEKYVPQSIKLHIMEKLEICLQYIRDETKASVILKTTQGCPKSLGKCELNILLGHSEKKVFQRMVLLATSALEKIALEMSECLDKYYMELSSHIAS